MARGGPPMFRSDVVGSLLRPAYLIRAREQREAGETGAAEFKRIEDRAVDEAIRLQEEAGLDVLTGGELVYQRPVVVEKLRWRRGMCAEEFTYVRVRTSHPAKVTLFST